MSITVHSNDEQPLWVATVSVNGTLPDYSTGHSFTCVVTTTAGVTLLTKTTNITGSVGGVITVTFTSGELSGAGATATFAVNNVIYVMFLTPRRIADSADGPTIQETLLMKWRP
jgi:hypothetical protein